LGVDNPAPSPGLQTPEQPKAAQGPGPGSLKAGEKVDPKAVEAKRLQELQQRIDREHARSSYRPDKPTTAQPLPDRSAAMEGVDVEIVENGVTKRVNASQWVQGERSSAK
jgi:hypothetical protein